MTELSEAFRCGQEAMQAHIAESISNVGIVDEAAANAKLAAVQLNKLTAAATYHISETEIEVGQLFPGTIGLVGTILEVRQQAGRPLPTTHADKPKAIEQIRVVRALLPPKVSPGPWSPDYVLARRAFCLAVSGPELDINTAAKKIHKTRREIVCNICPVRNMCTSPYNLAKTDQLQGERIVDAVKDFVDNKLGKAK